MDTIRKEIDVNCIKENDFAQAGEVLRNGGLVAFPTETVYGLGANALDASAAAKIYAAKGRPSDNPLIVHIADEADLEGLVEEISDKAKVLMKEFWPGPLTLIFKKTEKVPMGTTGGLNTVAIRMPDHKVALELIREAGVPVAAPSANTSGRPSPTTAAHVFEDMEGRIDMIIDGGKVGIGIESTIVDMTVEPPMILRPGYITEEMLNAKIGVVQVDKVVVAKNSEELQKDNYAPKAPGMKYRHYAPKADLTMYEGDIDHVIKVIQARQQQEEALGRKVGIICTEESRSCYQGDCIVSIGSRQQQETIAANLYEVLRDFDNTDVDVILGETFYGDGLGQAIMNRLIKAAGYKLVDADLEIEKIKK